GRGARLATPGRLRVVPRGLAGDRRRPRPESPPGQRRLPRLPRPPRSAPRRLAVPPLEPDGRIRPVDVRDGPDRGRPPGRGEATARNGRNPGATRRGDAPGAGVAAGAGVWYGCNRRMTKSELAMLV